MPDMTAWADFPSVLTSKTRKYGHIIMCQGLFCSVLRCSNKRRAAHLADWESNVLGHQFGQPVWASQSLTAHVCRARTRSMAHHARKDLGGLGVIGNCPSWKGLSLNLPSLCSARSGIARARQVNPSTSVRHG